MKEGKEADGGGNEERARTVADSVRHNKRDTENLIRANTPIHGGASPISYNTETP